MKIFVTGTRGIPNIPGGIEKHCQELYPLIVQAGHEVILATRTPYVSTMETSWSGVQLCHIFAPRKKNIEAIVHTFLSILKARFLKVDLIHIHAIGPGLLAPFARLLGLRVVLTNHGPDYNRKKWGWFAQSILRLGEFLGGRYANEIIVISSTIADIMKKRCNRSGNLIYNGVSAPPDGKKTDFLSRLTIIPGQYILAVARFVPEKGLHDLIRAFRQIPGEWQLVIVGDTDHPTPYSQKLKEDARLDKRIFMTGYITGSPLHQLFSNARLFVLPSYHEGLPIALLEAMSYRLPVLVSDIPANKEIDLHPKCFYACGSQSELSKKILDELNSISTPENVCYDKKTIEKFDWHSIANKTIEVFYKALA